MFANCTKQARNKGKFDKSNWFHSSSISLVILHKHLCFCKSGPISMQNSTTIFHMLNSSNLTFNTTFQRNIWINGKCFEYLNELKLLWILNGVASRSLFTVYSSESTILVTICVCYAFRLSRDLKCLSDSNIHNTM